MPDYHKTLLSAEFCAFKASFRRFLAYNAVMFTPWIKRKSLKRDTKSKRLVVDGAPPSMIMLLAISAIFVGVGLFVIQRGLAEDQREFPLATPTPTPSVLPSGSPTPSATPTPVPVHGAPVGGYGR